MNVFTGIGRTTKDVELRYSEKGTAVARFTLAINRRFNREKTDFLNCVAFGKTAELIAQYVKKGNRVGVSGEVQTDSYEKDGRRIYTTNIVVNEVEFLESSREQQKPYKENPLEQAGEQIDVQDSDLPF